MVKHRFYVFGIALLLAGCGGSPPKPPVTPVTALPPKPALKARMAAPEHVKGVYVTAWFAGSTTKLDKLIGLVDRTELNTMVIDIRDAGHIYVKTEIPEAKQSGAQTVAILKPDKVVQKLIAKGVYPIARIACFRDNFIPKTYSNRAVNTAKGQVWKDRGGYMWLDPYNHKNWEYIAKIVDFALDLGFPEIQLDYVRFPSEGKSADQVFPAKKYWPTKTDKPKDVVAKFAKAMADRVHKQGARISADIFGIISSAKTDQGIGQELEDIAAPFDVISPMIYPSHFHKGEYGIADPNQSPHAIVLKSLRDYAKRLPNKSIRPWLQDFSLGVTYGPEQVRAQIKAAKEIGYNDYLIWNAKNVYSEAAYTEPKQPKP